MAPYDWMTDPQFRLRIQAVAGAAARRIGMEEYDAEIVGWIADRIRENSRQRILNEMQKREQERRTEHDALESVELLVEAASRSALLERRRTVTVDDVKEAYRANFCRIWPIC